MRLTNRGFLYTPPPAGDDDRPANRSEEKTPKPSPSEDAGGERSSEVDRLTEDEVSTGGERPVSDITPTASQARWTGLAADD